MATDIKITNEIKELAREYDIDILKKQVKDLTDRVEKLEAQFTWPCSLSSDWNYVKENPWDERPFELTKEQITEYLNKDAVVMPWNKGRNKDTSLSKRPDNYVRYEDLSTWSTNDKN